jgi:hypothetical protein
MKLPGKKVFSVASESDRAPEIFFYFILTVPFAAFASSFSL